MITKFNSQEGLIIIPGRLYGSTGDTIVRFALDTGATYTIVNRKILLLLGYNPDSASRQIQITTASKVEFAPQIDIEMIEAMGQTNRNFPILCHSLPAGTDVDGLLGLDFLKGNKLIIDFRKGTINFR